MSARRQGGVEGEWGAAGGARAEAEGLLEAHGSRDKGHEEDGEHEGARRSRGLCLREAGSEAAVATVVGGWIERGIERGFGKWDLDRSRGRRRLV